MWSTSVNKGDGCFAGVWKQQSSRTCTTTKFLYYKKVYKVVYLNDTRLILSRHEVSLKMNIARTK